MKQVIVLITVLVCSEPALACSCDWSVTTAEHFSWASNVFRARIEAVETETILSLRKPKN